MLNTLLSAKGKCNSYADANSDTDPNSDTDAMYRYGDCRPDSSPDADSNTDADPSSLSG